MTSSLLFWTALAILVFWAVGAYNRLVRLRSDVNAGFAALDAELSRQVALVLAMAPAPEDLTDSQFDGGSAFWTGLQSAASQFAASLAAARQKPLDPERIAALGAAHEILDMAWDRALRDDAHDLAGARLPETVMQQRAHLAQATQAATENFNRAVARYNDAIAQFPALVLAWIFGFAATRGLRARP
ncbi:LemA family protein [Ramlibacter sp.]|uniref:LemA family protein n=1 Tax=Ramlibacter sp. TaxID=1917967 RepID=UPI003D11BE02